MICKKCGHNIGEEDNFCEECGAALDVRETAVSNTAYIVSPSRKKSTRFIVIGFLNIIFSLLYLIFLAAVIYSLTLPDTSGLEDYNLADLIGNTISAGTTALILIIAGILLLAGKKAGRHIIAIAIGITVGHLLFVVGIYLLIQATYPSTLYVVELDAGLLFGRSVAQCIYPLIAFLILPRAPGRSQENLSDSTGLSLDNLCPYCGNELAIAGAGWCDNCEEEISLE